MANRKKYVMMGLASAAGAAAAFYGVRALLRWRERTEDERRQMDYRLMSAEGWRPGQALMPEEQSALDMRRAYDYDSGQRVEDLWLDAESGAGGEEEERGAMSGRMAGRRGETTPLTSYQPADRPDRNPVPVTGDSPAVPGFSTEAPTSGAPTGFPSLTRSTREAMSDEVDNRAPTPGTSGGALEEAGVDDPANPEQVGVPTTGGRSLDAAATWGVVNTEGDELDEELGDLQDPNDVLAQYLVTFHEMMTTLRQRREESGAANTGMGSSLVPSDRARYQDILERLEMWMVELEAQGALESGTLEYRVRSLTDKVRDALENLDYTDDDLFRINGEIRSQACQVLPEIFTGSDVFERAREAYACP